MPVNGSCWKADKRRWRWVLDGSGSHSGIGTGSYGSSFLGAIFTTPDSVLESALVALSGGYNITAGTNSVTYVGLGAPLGVTWTDSGPLTLDIVASAEQVYNIGGNWLHNFVWRVYLNGSLKLATTITGAVSGGLGPHYLLYGAMCIWGSVSASASTTGLPGPLPSTFAYASSVDATLTMSMEFQEPGSVVWQHLPVTFHPSSAPSVPGGCTDPGVGGIAGTTTESVVLTAHSEQSTTRSVYETGTITACCLDIYCNGNLIDPATVPYVRCQTQAHPLPWTRYKTESELLSRAADAGVIPDEERGIKRFATETGFLCYRARMPQTTWAGSASCDDNGVSSSTSDGGVVHPRQDVILQIIGDSLAAMEDTLGYRAYSEAHRSGGWSKTVTYETSEPGGIACPAAPIIDDCQGPGDVLDYVYTSVGLTPQPPNESYSSSRSYTFPSSVGPKTDMVGYLRHELPRPRYLNSWCNPLWSYFNFFDDWPVDGSPRSRFAYWMMSRQQTLDNVDLPSPSKIRNHIISDPLAYDGDRSFLDAFCGTGLAWVGISRWQTKETTPLTDYTYGVASAPLWSVDHGTLSVAAGGLTSTPSGAFAGDVTFELLLSSFLYAPFLWPALADTGNFDYDAGNISGMAVELVGRNGETVAWPVTRGVDSAWPFGKPVKYCGSHYNDFGLGIVTDQGADYDASGDSSVVFNDPALCMASQGLASRTAAKIRFKVTPIDGTQPVVLKWPRLKYTKASQAVVINESACGQVVVHPDGPGVRVGQQIWYDAGGAGWVNPPLVGSGAYKSTIVDQMEVSRVLVEGLKYDDGFTTECTNRYDSFEGNSVGQVDRDSVGFVLPFTGDGKWRFALVNSYSEVPPVGNIPARKRDPSTWQPTGDFGQVTWIWAQGESVNISPVDAAHTVSPASVQWTSSVPGISGWAKTKHSHALTNTEAGFFINENGTHRGKDFRPFRGVYEEWPPRAPGGGVWISKSPWAHFYLAQTDDDGILFRKVNAPWPQPGYDQSNVVLDPGDTGFRMVYEDHALGRHIGVFERAGNVMFTATRSDGRTWDTPETLAAGMGPTVAYKKGVGTIVAWREYVSGSSGPCRLKGVFKGVADAAFGSPFTMVDQTSSDIVAADDTFHIIHQDDGLDPFLLGVTLDGDTLPSVFMARDGKGRTWLKVT